MTRTEEEKDRAFADPTNIMWSMPFTCDLTTQCHYFHVPYDLERSLELAGEIFEAAPVLVYRRQDQAVFNQFDQELLEQWIGVGLPDEHWERWQVGRDLTLRTYAVWVEEVREFLRNGGRRKPQRGRTDNGSRPETTEGQVQRQTDGHKNIDRKETE
jgi:hypothetical protein